MTRKKTTTGLLALLMSALMLFGCIPDTGLIANAADDEAGWIEAGDADVTDDADADDGTADPADGLLNELGLGDLIVDEYEDDNDPATYQVWIGDVQITETNKDDVLGDGKVSFDPASHTLTLKNAVLNKMTTKEGGAPSTSVNICARETLIIKGSAKLTNAYNSIVVGPESLLAKEMPSLTIDADLDIDAVNSGISTIFVPVYINGGNISIKSGIAGILGTVGDVTAKGGKLKLTGAMIGIMSSRSLIINGAAIEAEGSEGAVMANPAPDSTIEIYSPSFIEEPSGTSIAPAKIQGKNGQAIVDSNGDPVKNIKIGLNSVTKKVTVTFDLNGHGLGTIPPRVIGKGDKVCAPPEPLDNGWTFAGWYTEAACSTKYDFNSSVNADMTLYAKWTKQGENPGPGPGPEDPDPVEWPEPIYGSGSPLDPLPTVIPGETTDLYLVKGQKFDIGEGWYLDKDAADYKDSKKVVSISKKGAFNAKKAGEATITCGKGENTYTIKVHVSAPKFEKKKLNLEIVSANDLTVTELNFIHDDNLEVIYHSSSPDVAMADGPYLALMGKGSTRISAYVNGCVYTCTVSVKEKAIPTERSMHMIAGSSKSIKVKGVKGWKSASDDIALITNKAGTKVKAVNPGYTILTASANGVEYFIDLCSDDLTITGDKVQADGKPGKNKYKIDLTAGETTDLVFSENLYQEVIFKSNKPGVAFVDEAGHVIARNKGKAKFTAKVDGKTITITVNVSAAPKTE